MRKVWKSLAGAVSALAIAAAGLVGVATASADDTTDSTASGSDSITITNLAPGDTYAAYELLTVTGASGTGADAKVAYALNSKYTAVLQQVTGQTTPAGIIDYISKLPDDAFTGAGSSATTGGDAAAVRSFAASVMAAIKDAKLEPDQVQTAAAGATSVTFDLPLGYYLFNQTVNGAPSTNTNSSFIVNTNLSGSQSIAAKRGTVTLTKKVKDNDPNGDVTGSTTWIDSADYNIGDKVPYILVGTIPANYSSFDTFKYVFTDTLSKGLTLDQSSIQVNVVNNPNTSTASAQNITKYFTVATSTNADGQTVLTLTNDNLKAIQTADDGTAANIGPNTQIVVSYDATLNSNAVIAGDGNPNTASLTFSDNASNDGSGETTSTTPEDKVAVFTYKVDVNKTFDVGKPADNDLPQFTLYKYTGTDANPTASSEGWVEYTNGLETSATKTVTANADGTYTLSFQGLDAGTYKLVESHTPGGYNTAAPEVFTINADHEITSDDPKLLGTTSPNVTLNIQNTSGSMLPSTGGIGTTLFYGIGAVLVLAAGIGLVVAVRRRRA
ncbi:isopeptide-forming domain-containing fimbrial protein [Bifidobacterium cuniculi]|uniref:Putative LPXTG-motif protein cell wall anchor domain protein n=1 Tax=Bifidobacterium cuniculi TaxID=1688 RepID=A0A087AWM7_9BIFI|nr:isopeptide-forming domain-containing fimbrial protein [Bifidobacterium cuniculi]KFI63177.1 putative LPXTG-motif protein cell wall anchor domain protein [Bifidobacterium cuniculi]